MITFETLEKRENMSKTIDSWMNEVYHVPPPKSLRIMNGDDVLDERRAARKKKMMRAVIYLAILGMAVGIWFTKAHWFGCLFLDFVFAAIALGLYCMDEAVVVDDRVAMSHEERIIQEELELKNN